jgi:tetratricopeptide (TPR) repeat protein
MSSKLPIKIDEGLTIFVGAGISFDSKIPVVNEILTSIIKKINSSDTFFENSKWYKNIGELKNSDFFLQEQFERFMSYLCSTIGKEPFNNLLLSLFHSEKNGYTPNINHSFIAQLVKQKYCKKIYTTNFDTLIEEELENVGLENGKDFEVIYENFQKSIDCTDKIQIIKLHGCITNIKSIITTMESLLDNNILPDRIKIIQSIFTSEINKALLIMGYSFSDQYDINRYALDYQENNIETKHIYYIQHTSKFNNCFKVLNNFDSNLTFLNSFQKKTIIRINTKYFVKQFSVDLGIKLSYLKNRPNTTANLDARINQVLSYSSSYNFLIIAGELAQLTGNYQESINCFKKGIFLIEKKLNDFSNLLRLYNNLGLSYNELGQLDKAIESYEKIITISNNVTKNEEHVATAYNNIGTVWREKGIFNKAYYYFKASIDISRKLGKQNSKSLAISLHNLGEYLADNGEFSKAVVYYLESISIKKRAKVIDYPSIANSYNSLGAILVGESEYDEALYYYEKAADTIVDAYGTNHIFTSGVYSNMGVIYNKIGRYDTAKTYLKMALVITKDILGDNHTDVGIIYNNLGQVYRNENNLNKALEYFQKDLKITINKYGVYHPSIAMSYINIGTLFASISEFKKAIYFYEKAKLIFINSFPNGHPNIDNINLSIEDLKNQY